MSLASTLSAILSKAKAISALLPTIVSAVQAVEASINIGGQGAQKLDAVLAIVQAAYEVEQAAVGAIPWTDLLPAIKTVIAAFVTLFNKTGVFTTSQAQSA